MMPVLAQIQDSSVLIHMGLVFYLSPSAKCWRLEVQKVFDFFIYLSSSSYPLLIFRNLLVDGCSPNSTIFWSFCPMEKMYWTRHAMISFCSNCPTYLSRFSIPFPLMKGSFDDWLAKTTTLKPLILPHKRYFYNDFDKFARSWLLPKIKSWSTFSSSVVSHLFFKFQGGNDFMDVILVSFVLPRSLEDKKLKKFVV